MTPLIIHLSNFFKSLTKKSQLTPDLLLDSIKRHVTVMNFRLMTAMTNMRRQTHAGKK